MSKIMKYLPIFSSFLLALLVVTNACQDTGIEPSTYICFEERGDTDLGPEKPFDYDYYQPRNNFGSPVAHPMQDDTLYYLRWIVDETGNFPLINQEIWQYSFSSREASLITDDLLFTTGFDVNHRGEIAFVARQGLSIIRSDGTGQEVIYPGDVNGIRWHGNGDTLYFVTGSTDSDMAYREGNTWAFRKRNPRHTPPYTFSPDGQIMARLEYQGVPGVYESLILVDQQGNLLRRYINVPVGHTDLELHPDGEWAYWTGTQVDKKYQLQRMSLQTEEIQTLRIYDATDRYGDFGFVEKGTRLVIRRNISDSLGNNKVLQRSELWIMDSNGCNEYKLELPEG